MTSWTPLNAFRHIETVDLAALEQSVQRQYPGAKFDLVRGAGALDAVACLYRPRDVGLAYSRLGARLRIKIPERNVYGLIFGHKGHARAVVHNEEVELGQARGLVCSPLEPLQLDYSSEFEHLVLTIKEEALTKRLEALSGRALTRALQFSRSADFSNHKTATLKRLFLFLAEQMDLPPSSLHPIAMAELEQAIIISFLDGNEHNYSHLLHRKTSPSVSQVQRAEAYIEANWDQPITIEALALVTGVSARSLFLSFEKNRGCSPMDFVKRIRLSHAKEMLSKPSPASSVTTIAFACGFGNLGHFASYYRRQFGELPSVTLQRSLRRS
jgi:AraC-like DNA-binding protein